METFPRTLSVFIYRLEGFCQCLQKKAQNVFYSWYSYLIMFSLHLKDKLLGIHDLGKYFGGWNRAHIP